MAAIELHATSGAQTLGNGKTILQVVAAANHRLKVKGWGISMNGTSSTDAPVKVECLRQTTAGTMSAGTTGTNLSKKDNSGSETIQSSVQVNATVEPTAGDILFTEYVHPQTGFYYFDLIGREIIVPGGARVGWRVTTALTYSCAIEADYEE